MTTRTVTTVLKMIFLKFKVDAATIISMMLHLLEKSRGRRCRAQGNTKTLNVEIHVYSQTQPISAQSIWQAGEVFLPRSEVFLPISSWMSDYLDKTVTITPWCQYGMFFNCTGAQLSGTIRNVRYAVCTPISCQCSCCTPRNSITFQQTRCNQGCSKNSSIIIKLTK